MVLAALTHNGRPVSPLWLIGGKLGLTLGEMIVLPSPIVPSLVSRQVV